MRIRAGLHRSFVLGMGVTLVSLLVAATPKETATSEEVKHEVPHPQPKEVEAHEAAVVSPLDRDGCIVDQEAIEDIRRARQELSHLKAEWEARLQEVSAKEKSVLQELGKIEEQRKQLLALQQKTGEDRLAQAAKVVETLENMSPGSAAKLIASLDESLAVSAMKQLSTQKLAKIMNLMEPARAARLSEALSGYQRSPASDGK